MASVGGIARFMLSLPHSVRTNTFTAEIYLAAKPFASTAWWQVLVIALLTAWLYESIFVSLVAQWYQDPNYSHGFLVPLFSLFLLWRERSRFCGLLHQPSAWGLLLIFLSLCLLAIGVLGAELFLSRVSFPFLIAGLVISFLGWKYFRVGLYAWMFLFLMIPVPAILLNQVTLPLQGFASLLAAAALPLLGVPVLREGNIINLPAMPLEIAEACSGIRSLLSLITLATMYGYLANVARWIRVTLVLAAMPIAIAANSLRIIGTGLLVQSRYPDKAQGFFHMFSGWVIFLVSMFILFLFHRALVWAEEEWRLGHQF